jgi:hypothetical protein
VIDKISSTNKISDRQQEKEFWKEKNEKCLKCKKLCKQSKKATVISCINFEENNKGEV